MHPRSVLNGDYRITSLLCGLAGYYGKRYVFPSQDWILKKLAVLYGRSMSRSTLCRHMSALERDGWIKRTQRHTRDPRGGILFRSTLYQLTRKTLRFARSMSQVIGLGGSKPPGTSTNTPCAISDTISLPQSTDYTGARPKAADPPDKEQKLVDVSIAIGTMKQLLT